MNNKGIADINLIIGFIVIVIGTLSISFMGFGFIFENPTLVLVGTIVLIMISFISAFFEYFLLR